MELDHTGHDQCRQDKKQGTSHPNDEVRHAGRQDMVGMLRRGGVILDRKGGAHPLGAVHRAIDLPSIDGSADRVPIIHIIHRLAAGPDATMLPPLLHRRHRGGLHRPVHLAAAFHVKLDALHHKVQPHHSEQEADAFPNQRPVHSNCSGS